jgi:membrane-bound serine protease (ClpP class)
MSPGAGFLHALFDPNLAFIFFWVGLLLIVIELIVPGHIFAGTIGTVLLMTSLVSFGFLPVRLIGIALLIASVVFFILEVKAPGLGIWSIAGLICLVAGGPLPLRRLRRRPRLTVGPDRGRRPGRALLRRRGIEAAGHPARAAGPPRRRGTRRQGGRGDQRRARPDGVVRVGSEEWGAVSSAGPLRGDTRIRVTGLNGLVLTVEPLIDEHVPASSPAEGGPTT